MLVDDSATIVYDPGKITKEQILGTIEDLGYGTKCLSERLLKDLPSEVVRSGPRLSSTSQHDHTQVEITLSIGGMTCASCVGAINNMLSAMEGISKHEINLMDGSGKVVAESEGLAETVRSEIEDLGYDCKIMNLDSLTGLHHGIAGRSKDSMTSRENMRTVNIRIQGFFCDHCPAKTNRVLESLAEQFQFSCTPSSLVRPESTLTYRADPPKFTLRTIQHALAQLGFTLQVIKPETLQDRARSVQRRERSRILLRLICCIVFCVPTFIIGVVAASLLPQNNAVKMYFEMKIWGNASRMTMALFCLATPIQFGIGQFFYSRAYKSLRGVWRRRANRVSRKKVWIDRLLRWGSMDTLVALGTTIAWASSLAYMILDVTGLGSGEMAYFDSCVFLTTFILAGRYLVGWMVLSEWLPRRHAHKAHCIAGKSKQSPDR